jgi:hypothetical protein
MKERRRQINRCKSFVKITPAPTSSRFFADGTTARGEALSADRRIEATVIGWRAPRQVQR